MAVEVRFLPSAETDLFDLYRHIAEDSGRARAGAYIDRLEAACLGLADFPERGTRRDDLRPGLRTLGFERRATIVFRIVDGTVEIGRILYGGRDLEALRSDSTQRAIPKSPRPPILTANCETPANRGRAPSCARCCG